MSHTGQIIKRAGQEHRQELVKLIKQAAYTRPTWQIWDDLIYMGATALSQPTMWVQEREDEYLARIKRYEKKTQGLFPQMFAEITLAFEQEGCTDVLGSIYMQLELNNHWKGQYFTPSTVCDFMAACVETDLHAQIEKKGYITVNEIITSSLIQINDLLFRRSRGVQNAPRGVHFQERGVQAA